MIRIAALNDSSSDFDDAHEDRSVGGKVTKEAQENAAYSLYHKGLSYERAGATLKAIHTFEELLKDNFITKPEAISDGKQLHQCDILKYSALKNLAKLYSSEGRNEEAIEVLLEAFAIDSTDVSVCYRLGVLANKLARYVLACRAFEKGLELSPDHWPCLDNLIMLFYILNNYEACLYYIGKSLARDCGYVKGLVIRKAIYKEQPSLEKDFAKAFDQCDAGELNECTARLLDSDESEVLEEAKAMKIKMKEQRKPKLKRSINLDLTELSWATLGRRLVEIFFHIEDNAPELDHFSPIVMNRKCVSTTTDKGPLAVSEVVDAATEVGYEQDDEKVPLLEFEHATDSDLSQCALSADPHFSSDNMSTGKVGSDTEVYHDSDAPSNHGCRDKDSVACVAEDTFAEISSEQDNASHDETAATIEEYGGGEACAVEQVLFNMVQCIAGESNDASAAQRVVEHVVLRGGHSKTFANVVHDTVKQGQLSDVEAVEQVLSELVQQVEEADHDTKIVEDVLGDIVQQVSSAVDRKVTCEHETTIAALLEELVSHVERNEKLSSPIVEDDVYAEAPDSPPSLEQEKTKKGRFVSAAESKRRSMRVKLPATKPGNNDKPAVLEKSNHLIKLKSILTKLLDVQTNDEHIHGHDSSLTSVPHSLPNMPSVEPDSFPDEEGDVSEFLAAVKSSRGVISTMRDWLVVLSKKRQFVWSSSLASAYVDVYEKHRPCFQMPNIFSDEVVEVDVLLALLYMELKIDQITVTGPFELQLGSLFVKEFTYWQMVIGNEEKLASNCQELTARYYYMAARYYIGLGQPLIAINIYKNFLAYLMSLDEKDFSVSLNNNSCAVVLNKSVIEAGLAVLERTEALNELSTVYNDCDYHGVLSLLEPTFDAKLANRYTNSRFSQLDLLLNTIEKLTDSGLHVKWLSYSLEELVYHAENRQKGDWKKLIIRNLSSLDMKLDGERKDFSPVYMKQIGMSCLKLLELNVAALESGQRMPVGSVLPWIVLSKLCDTVHVPETDSPSHDTPSSLEILKVAHELLAKHSLCTSSGGLLLKYFLEKLFERLSIAGTYDRQPLEQQVSQCIFCLYGHPNKKIKAKNLTDHGAPTVSLTWTAARQLFDYYKPKSVPDFDSYKSSTISAELESLFRKLISEVPPDCAADPKIVKVVDAYLNNSATLDDLAEVSPPSCSSICSEAFYLLADYYFKNKEPLKAIKHYVQDLYYKPNRFDSWAGMALAKCSKLESRLRLMERQSYDGAFQKLAVSTVQSFDRALELKQDNVKLWIEYACSAYQLHSFASRVIKAKKSELNSSELATFTALRKDMLVKSKHCYEQASLCTADEFKEPWLHHYMLGKIAEKSHEDPSVYLSHYVKAGKCLNDEGAQYPAKISYMYNLPYLAVEALEMYYRVHASVLKSVQRSQSTQHFQLFSEIIHEMKKCSFSVPQTPSPQTPITRKRKAGSEANEKSSGVKAKKSDSDLLISSSVPKVSTRRQEKLRLDAEIVSEVLEEIVCRIEAVDDKDSFHHSSHPLSYTDSEQPHAEGESLDRSNAPVHVNPARVLFCPESMASPIYSTPHHTDRVLPHGEGVPVHTEGVLYQAKIVPSHSKSNSSQTEGVLASVNRKQEIISFYEDTREKHAKLVQSPTDSSLMMDVKAALQEIVSEVSNQFDTLSSDPEESAVDYPSTLASLSLACLNTPAPSNTTLNDETISAAEEEKVFEKSIAHNAESFPDSPQGTAVSAVKRADDIQDYSAVESGSTGSLEAMSTVNIPPSHSDSVKRLCLGDIAPQLDSDERHPSACTSVTATQSSKLELDDEKDVSQELPEVLSRSPIRRTTPIFPDSTSEDVTCSDMFVGAEPSHKDSEDTSADGKEVQSNVSSLGSISGLPTITVTQATSSINSSDLVTAFVSNEVGLNLASPGSDDFPNTTTMGEANIVSKAVSDTDVSPITPVCSVVTNLAAVSVIEAPVHTRAPAPTLDENALSASILSEAPITTSVTPSMSSSASTAFLDLPAVSLKSSAISSTHLSNVSLASAVSPDVAPTISTGSTSFLTTLTSLSMASTTSLIASSTSSIASTTSSIVSIASSTEPGTSSTAPATSLIASTTSSISTNISLIASTTSSTAPATSSIASTTSSTAPATSSTAPATSSIATNTSSIASTTSSVASGTSSILPTASSIASVTSSIASGTSLIISAISSIARTTSSVASTTSSIALATLSIASASSSVASSTLSLASTTSLTASTTSSMRTTTSSHSFCPASSMLHAPLASSLPSVTSTLAMEAPPSTSSGVLSRDELIESCIAGLKLCVQRYPLHYKSYFRLAKTFLHDSRRKDLDKVQDLLLGNTSKKREDRFVPQGLFQDRKHNNFFNGVWSNPVQEVERAGSFGAHLYKSIYLLLQFLHEKRDYHLLYQLHTQLQRTPDQERKFLKDADRLLLSSKAIEFAIHSLYKTIGSDPDSKAEYNYAASLHQAYKWFVYCNKHTICVPNAQVLLMKAFKSYKLSIDKDFDATSKVPVTVAKDFCQQMFSNRSKDKSKTSTESKQAQVEGGKPTSRASPSPTKTLKDASSTTLPSVRGSFQSFDKSLKSKRIPLNTEATNAAEPSVPKVSAPSDIPSTSWLNKAKDGTKALASMFTKPK